MAETRPAKSEGLSLQTLIIAAIASAVAAILTSHFWKAGTVFASAMTPVIVALTKELLRKPIESDIVRRPAQRFGSIAASRITTAPQRGRVGEPVGASRARREFLPPEPPPAQLDDRGRTPDGLTPGDIVMTGRRNTYGARSGGPSRRHIKLAIVTGLLAFVVAAVVITVPELVFGGAVASHHSTTLFGGGSSKPSKSDNQKSKNQNGQGGSTTSPQSTQPQNGSTQPSQTTPQQTTPGTQTPQGGTQTPTTQQQAPAPAPASPPPSGGTTTPSPTSP